MTIRLLRPHAGESELRIQINGEIVEPHRKDGLWHARVHGDATAEVLCRDYGFRRAYVRRTVRRGGRRADITPRHPMEAWRLFLQTAPHEESRIGSIDDARSVVDASALDLTSAPDPMVGPLPVTVVLTLTGWGDLDRPACDHAVGACERSGAHLVVVQNDPASFERTEAWAVQITHGIRPDVVLTGNAGFAAACNAGAARVARGTEWLLFTQSDATWDEDGLRWACGRSRAIGRDRPAPAVGPSGGMLNGTGISERGRNVRQQCGIVRVDFLTGYWVLVPHRAFKAIGGWDEGFFLYWEDPDLCLRLAMIGCASIVDTRIEVEHRRSSTIRSLFQPGEKGEIQQWSTERFARRWGA